MAPLLDIGLRGSEIAQLEATNVDVAEQTLTLYRPKIDKEQTLELKTEDLKRAFHAWFKSGDAPVTGRLLRCNAEDGKLKASGMTVRMIRQVILALGEQIGVERLSAYDLRQSWANHAKTGAITLREGEE